MKPILILILAAICSCSNKKEKEIAKDNPCCSYYPHPNFDCRSAWMEGVIMTGNNIPVGYSKGNKNYYYRDYIEQGVFKEDKRWRKLYTLDTAENCYEYTPMNDTALVRKLVKF